MPKSLTKFLLSLAFVATLLALYLANINQFLNFSYGQNGTYDFVQYWAAFRLFITGEEIYSPHSMLAIQKVVGADSQMAVMMWNPPWTLLILSPVLIFEFQKAAALWLLCNIAFLLASAFLVRSIYKPNFRPSYIFPATVCFLPVWEAINWGQLSIYLLFSASLFMHGMVKKKVIQTSIALVLMSVKPQLFLVLAIVFAFDVFKNGKYKLMAYAIGLLLLLVFTCLLISPHSISSWLLAQSAISGGDPALGVYDWKPATLMTWVRIFFPSASQTVIWLAPIIVCLSTIFYLLYDKTEINWKQHSLIVLPLSLLAAPYAWFYDQSVFLFIQLCICLLISPVSKFLVIPLILIQIMYGLMMASPSIAQHHYAIFLPIWLVVAWLASQRFKTDLQLSTDPQ